MSVVSGPLEQVLALLGRQDLIGGGFDLITHSSRGIVDLVSEAVDHVAGCLEDGGHGEGCGNKCGCKQVRWSVKQWMV
jgi:hypothetical protein